ncbi:hypothetical protein HELRODRAFT_162968 [Helobdella robusta]|uniref:Uncharacterized protein n=1 Tax=Helobdella robusta TaxID=6412 RepID=T1ETG3_HELRO|nr:hypothetical protein HELRODRAFT_162968 [Helobdella robusta]ESN99420.1 hypothetical protein HELRODRAFT_162968 [Helobdella robusta]
MIKQQLAEMNTKFDKKTTDINRIIDQHTVEVKQLHKILKILTISPAYSTTYNYISDRKSILSTDHFSCGARNISDARVNCVAHVNVKKEEASFHNDKDDDKDKNECFENIEKVGYDKESFGMQWDYYSDFAASNSPTYLTNSDNGYSNSNDVLDGDVNANNHTEPELVTEYDPSFDIMPPTCTWKKSLVLVYLDDDINDDFIADEDESFIAASLIDRKDVNDEFYDMHQRYPSDHSTPRELNRKNHLLQVSTK